MLFLNYAHAALIDPFEVFVVWTCSL